MIFLYTLRKLATQPSFRPKPKSAANNYSCLFVDKYMITLTG